MCRRGLPRTARMPGGTNLRSRPPTDAVSHAGVSRRRSSQSFTAACGSSFVPRAAGMMRYPKRVAKSKRQRPPPKVKLGGLVDKTCDHRSALVVAKGFAEHGGETSVYGDDLGKRS